ncbi:MAG: aminotransferase class I/II-fold pyridoxal phosphate-dependent enzyme [Gammaproteobacteria bacterium]
MSPPTVSQRLRAVQAPIVPVVADLIRRHPGTLSLAQGMVWYGPPPQALAALGDPAVQPGLHRYGPDAGDPELIAAFCAKLERENGIRPGAQGMRVVVTAGSNMAFLNAVLAVTDPGDEIVLPSPYYFNHEMAIRMAGCVPVPVPSHVDFQPDVDAIRAALGPRTRMVVTVSPNNPSGAVYMPAAIEAINRLCGDAGIWHLSDEAYEYFNFSATPVLSPAALAGAAAHTISLFSMSKAYGMAGWRIGFMVLPESLYDPALKIQDTNVICAPLASQRLARAVLAVGADYCRERLAQTGDVRARVLRALAAAGVRVAGGEGAFYALLQVRTAMDDLELTTRLIAEHGIAVVPGSAFGIRNGCHLRVSYGTLLPENVDASLERLIRGLRALA